MEYEYIDHLTEYMKERVTKLIKDYRNSLPQELSELPDDRIIALITNGATPILRKIEDDAITAAIEKVSNLIRYSKAHK